MYRYKLTKITFNDGMEFEPNKLTIIVGPNNAGKSRILKDISAKTSQSGAPTIIVHGVQWTLPDNLEELRSAYKVERFLSPGGTWQFRALSTTLCGEYSSTGGGSWPKGYEHIIKSIPPKWAQFATSFGLSLIAFLSTEQRLQLVRENISPRHEREESNLLQSWFNAGSSYDEIIRKIVKDAFGQEIALDYSTLQRLRIRIGDDFSTLPPDPRDAKQLLDQYKKLDDQGDGIRSYVGLVVALLFSHRGLYLIDEPETFLHPPQSFRIGTFIADRCNDDHQIIVATHSVDVLRGILSRTRNLNILRVDRRGDTNQFRLLDAEGVSNLVNDPLLSSARVLDGLFYSGAIVVEADSDARFYQAASNKRRSNLDFHFVNADNKQTVPRITKIYRDMGVRCVGVVDFDSLNNDVEFTKQLEALGLKDDQKILALEIRKEIAQAAKEMPPDERIATVKSQLTELLNKVSSVDQSNLDADPSSASEKNKILRQVESRCREIAESTKDWKQFKQEGKAGLPPELQSRFDEVWNICSQNGLFINPCGELESMLTDYGIPYTTEKRSWITQALQLLAGLEVNDTKNPWAFIKQIHEYLKNGE